MRTPATCTRSRCASRTPASRASGSAANRRSRLPPKSVKAPPAGDRPLKTLERVVSKAGLGSRTEARKWIGAGRIKVNGKVEG
ncbi:MAG TPA: S4 domain-containing protein, partial [Thermoanaerobaculia bacterium]|nr:S4 domain-containing protein [Thermoanaerobaculia bacterium]